MEFEEHAQKEIPISDSEFDTNEKLQVDWNSQDEQAVINALVSNCLADRPEDVAAYMEHAVEELEAHSSPLIMSCSKAELLQKIMQQLDASVQFYQQVVAEMDSPSLQTLPQAGRLRPYASFKRMGSEGDLTESLERLQQQAHDALYSTKSFHSKSDGDIQEINTIPRVSDSSMTKSKVWMAQDLVTIIPDDPFFETLSDTMDPGYVDKAKQWGMQKQLSHKKLNFGVKETGNELEEAWHEFDASSPVHLDINMHTPQQTPTSKMRPGRSFSDSVEADIIPTEEDVIGVCMDGDIEFLKELHLECSEICTTAAMDAAAGAGHLDIIEWLHINCTKGASTQAMDAAAEHGHLEVVEWLHNNRTEGCTKAAMGKAALAGHFEVCNWLLANRTEGVEMLFLDKAAAANNLEAMKWLVEFKNAGCTKKAMDSAAANGNLEMVEYLQEKFARVGCTLNAMNNAAKHGHLEMVEWLHQHRKEGCTVQAMDEAASQGELSVVEWLHNNRTEGCTEDAIDGAARKGHLQTIQWLHEVRGLRVRATGVVMAAEMGHLEVLQWLHENQDIEITPMAIKLASQSGHFEVANWLENIAKQKQAST